MPQQKVSTRAKSIAAGVAAFALVAIIIWLDLTTGLWNELVVLSGLAAGLVTFLFTVLVLDKVVARSTARRWAPVNRLALSEFLHSIADEDRSEISKGEIVPRLLPRVDFSVRGIALSDYLLRLRGQVVEERSQLSDALSRWASFLASSGENELILRHVADIALRLDRVRDAALECEVTADAPTLQVRLTALDAQIQRSNAAMLRLEAELRARILREDREAPRDENP